MTQLIKDVKSHLKQLVLTATLHLLKKDGIAIIEQEEIKWFSEELSQNDPNMADQRERVP